MRKIFYYLKWAFQCKFLGKKIPLTSSVILTDRCNLKCRHCTVSHLGYPDMTYEQVIGDIRTLYDLGSRMLVITGGEPFLWYDGNRHLEDVVSFAKKLGFFRVVVCTNGTFDLRSSADYLWVSLDGFPAEHNEIRGDIYEKIADHLTSSTHENIYINFTISKINADRFEESAENILRMKKIKGILFHFFTPYVGSDPAMKLSREEMRRVLSNILRLKRRHLLKVSNTFDGIKAMMDNAWTRPVWSSVVANRGELTPCCCRSGIFNEETCRQCGCSPAVETYVLQELKPLAILEYSKFL